MSEIKEPSRKLREAARLLREKPVESTWVERIFLLDEAWHRFEGLPQPLILGRGLYEVLGHASLPTEPDDLLLGRYVDRVPDAEEEERFLTICREGRITANPITSPNGGHITLDWFGICREGLPARCAAAEARLARANEDGTAEPDLVRIEGMVWVWRAILLYVRRYADEAASAGMNDCAEVCRRLTESPPSTFREALQLLLIIFTVYTVYGSAPVGCLTLGRMDDALFHLYEADLAAGRLNAEEAGLLIEDFYCKCNLHLGRGEHQMYNPAGGGVSTGWWRNAGFDSPTYIVLGGRSRVVRGENPLTRLFVEHIDPALKNPVIIFRRTSDTDPALLRLLLDRMRNNASVLIYNDETVIGAYLHAGIDEADAVDYSVHPCNWADIAGGYAAVDAVYCQLPRLLTEVLNARFDYSSTDEIYAALAERWRPAVADCFARYRRTWRMPMSSNGTLSLTDCFLEGPLESGRGQFDGGVKYPAIYARYCFLGTAADMMAAVDELVFRRGVCTQAELCAACASDFESAPQLLALCRRAPKYGTDDIRADAHAARLLSTLLDVTDEEAVNADGIRDVYVLNVTISDSLHIGEGAALQATPDGRRRGAPLSENLSPSPGCADSITAMLNSVSSLPLGRVHSGACNLRLRRDAVRGEAGVERLYALTETYFDRGGMQLQISIADTDELRDAQIHPEKHRDLSVRVTGYSAIFTDMSAGAQEEIIRRNELS